eukprot:gb/GECG01007989.1/.p1 GENE.gb/GECG01007989.1/~~gb/GECG01007989.1/.p1  ORF type:complete len:244 (+),score=26.40 gb/GECG01007989.1/:1-732(+)
MASSSSSGSLLGQLGATVVKSHMLRTIGAYRPQPSVMHLPGLPQQPVYKADDFAWTSMLRENAGLIKQEYDQLRARGIESDYALKPDEHQLHSGQWDWFSYVNQGHQLGENGFQKYCPTTVALLEHIPRFMKDAPFGYAFFSSLEPGAKIDPHFGATNLRIRCHLPLDVPGNCGIKVAGQEYQWRAGEPFIFDDSFEHEAWNADDSGARVILLFDTWHPDITDAEQAAIKSLFSYMRDSSMIS